MVRRAISAACVAAMALALWTTTARAGGVLDVELRNRARVVGELDTAGELETYRIDVPAGARLSVVVRGVGRRGPDMRLALMDAGGALLDPPITDVRRGRRIRAFPVPGAGLYRIDVRSAGGKGRVYRLTASWSFDRVQRSEDAPAATTGSHAFGAQAGATPILLVRTTQAGATVVIKSLSGPNNYATVVSAPRRGPARRHRVRGPILPYTGTYTLTYETSAPGVPVIASVTVRRVRAKRENTRPLNRSPGGSGRRRFVSRRLDDRGGMVETPDLDATQVISVDSSGAAVGLPPAALDLPLGATGTISVATDGAADLEAPTVPRSAAGVLLEFGSPDSELHGEAMVTLPFDVGAFPDGQVPGTISVLHQLDDRSVVVVPATLIVDLETGTVSFPTSSFSTFQVAAPEREHVKVAEPVGPIDLSVPPDQDVLYVATDELDPTLNPVPGVLRQSVPGGPFEVYAGGGFATADLTQRLQFDFDQDVFQDSRVSAIHAAAGGQVIVVTTDASRTASAVYLIKANGEVVRVGGNGPSVTFFENALARQVGLPHCSGVTLSKDGEDILLVTDHYPVQSSDRVLALHLDPDPDEIRVSTVAGGGTHATSGFAPLETKLLQPRSILTDSQGRILVGDVDWLIRFDLVAGTTERLAGTNFGEGREEKDTEAERELGGQGAPLGTVVTGRLEDLAFDASTEDILYAADFNSGVVWRFDLKRDRAFVAAGDRVRITDSLVSRLARGTEQPSADGVEFPYAVAPRGSSFYVADSDDQLIVFRPKQ